MIFHYLQLLGGFVNVGVGDRKVRVRLLDFPRLYQCFVKHTFRGKTHRVEEHGAKVMSGALKADNKIYEFVRCVCLWGGDMRVYGNLLRHNGGAATAKRNVARAVRSAVDCLRSSQMESAIGEVRSVNGLGKTLGRMSYASKILRMLAPDRAVTFDDKLKHVFGEPLDNVGYQKWCDDCVKLARVLEQKKIKNTARANQTNEKWKAADIEAVIFAEAREKKKRASTSAKR